MSAISPTPPDRVASPEEEGTVPPLAVDNVGSPRRRVLALGIVLFVSFGHFIVSSAYYSIGGTGPADFRQYQVRLVGALIAEAGSLAVLWYVLSAQGRPWLELEVDGYPAGSGLGFVLLSCRLRDAGHRSDFLSVFFGALPRDKIHARDARGRIRAVHRICLPESIF